MIVGAGMGGLAAAADLASSGQPVLVLERAAEPGGKLRTVTVADAPIDAGPTVVTMRAVFDDLFAAAGETLDRHVTLLPLAILARHHWRDGTTLDLFADPTRTETEITRVMGRTAAHDFARFRTRSEAIYRTLDASFMQNPAPSLLSVTRDAGLKGAAAFRHASPFTSLWQALGNCFTDPRLRQLFARYATYSGASPFAAPATLMLIAHAEQQGVWRIAGGMRPLANAIADLAIRNGATFRFGVTACDILVERGRVTGVTLADGSTIAACAVIANTDLGAIATGLLGNAASRAIPAAGQKFPRSLSAITWQVVARTAGFPLSHHNVFFSTDYATEFAEIARTALPHDPTIYICAQDRHGDDDTTLTGPERLLILVNAPATGDRAEPGEAAIEQCWQRVLARLSAAGLTLAIIGRSTTGPVDFEALFPGSGGALYGRDLAGWRDPFQRPTARTGLPGFYLAGGSAHPGPGLPMAALSGRFAARAVREDYR